MNQENGSVASLRVFQLVERKLESEVKNVTEEKKIQNPNHMTMPISSFLCPVVLLFPGINCLFGL